MSSLETFYNLTEFVLGTTDYEFPFLEGNDSYPVASETNSTLAEDSSNFAAAHIKWISAISVGIVVVVYFCIMTAWGKHKKKLNAQRLIDRRQEALAPFHLYNALRTTLPPPPSYAQATGLYDLPPPYHAIAETLGQLPDKNLGVDNVALDIDEPSPVASASPATSSAEGNNMADGIPDTKCQK